MIADYFFIRPALEIDHRSNIFCKQTLADKKMFLYLAAASYDAFHCVVANN